MTEKRFCFVYSDGVKYLKVNGKVMPDNIALDLLNELSDENEKLKSHINDTEIAVEIETEKCMQKVFDWIDEKLREEKKAIEDMGEDYDDYYHLGKLDILNKMKEELQE